VRRGPIASGFWPLNFYQSPELLSIAILSRLRVNRKGS
jgi:hypothetical protein